MELRDSQYQSGIKMGSALEAAVQHLMSGLRKRDQTGTLRRRIEEVESLIKKVRRELSL